MNLITSLQAKTVVTIVVHDRVGHFLKWLRIASKMISPQVQFCVIHNSTDLLLHESWKKIANNYPIHFLLRTESGMDIGAFQEICEEKLEHFDYNFNYLLWFTDDCFPTDKNFIQYFTEPFLKQNNVGLVCSEISREIRPHVRTTGFCLKKETLKDLVFPVPDITTKQDCYAFEHGQNNLYIQMLKKNLKVVQIEKEFIYNPDSKKVKRYGLEKSLGELYQFIYGNGILRTLVFATAYNRFPQIISSVACQTWPTDLLIWHNGKKDVPTSNLYDSYFINVPNFTYKEIGIENRGNFGHPVKAEFLASREGACYEYLLITNEDNYLAPYMVQKAVETLEHYPDKIGAYCSGMIHNYKSDKTSTTWREKRQLKIEGGHAVDGYGLINCKIERGFIDISAIVLRTEIALSVPWPDYSHSSDWTYIENLAHTFGGKDKFISFPGIHLIHN